MESIQKIFKKTDDLAKRTKCDTFGKSPFLVTRRTTENKFKYQQMLKTAKPDKVPSQISTIDYE